MHAFEQTHHPIGKFQPKESYTAKEIQESIETISKFPKSLKKLLRKIPDRKFDMIVTNNGWTLRQLVHHLADSHLNAYVYMKLAVTEATPVVKTFDESLWVITGEVASLAPSISVELLDALHKRYVGFLKSLTEEGLKRGYFHPGFHRVILVTESIAQYAWQCNYQLSEIKMLVGKKFPDDPEVSKAPGRVKVEMVSTPDQPRRGRPRKPNAGNLLPKGRPGRPRKEITEVSVVEVPKLTKVKLLKKVTTVPTKELNELVDTGTPIKTRKRGRSNSSVKGTGESRQKLTRSQALEIARAARAKKLADKILAEAPSSIQKPKD